MKNWATAGLLLWPLAAFAEVTDSRLLEPTRDYGHGAVANGEYSMLEIDTDQRSFQFLYVNAVFEDTAPRLADLDGDGNPEVVTVLSSFDTGASLAIFGETDSGEVLPRLILDVVGQRFRWIAIAGIADFDHDGRVEIAYVDRPHLAQILRLVEVRGEGNTWSVMPDGTIYGLTNHHLGSAEIEGGLRQCPEPQLILAGVDWSRLYRVGYDGEAYAVTDIGAYTPEAMAAALECE